MSWMSVWVRPGWGPWASARWVIDGASETNPPANTRAADAAMNKEILEAFMSETPFWYCLPPCHERQRDAFCRQLARIPFRGCLPTAGDMEPRFSALRRGASLTPCPQEPGGGEG